MFFLQKTFVFILITNMVFKIKNMRGFVNGIPLNNIEQNH